MALWDLTNIRQRVRQVTGRFSPQELSNEQLDSFINLYFQYTFPAEVKLDRFHTYYEFLTSPNVVSYDLPSGYVNFEPQATINRVPLEWYQDPSVFDDQNALSYQSATPATGDGATVGFSFSAAITPIQPGSAFVTDNIEVFEDTNTTWSTSNVSFDGNLGGTGTINYDTGAVAVTFATAPADGQSITFSYVQQMTGQPYSVLLYNNKFKFYPVPDGVYRFRCPAYTNQLVSKADGTIAGSFSDSTDRPLLDEWGMMIVYGTARDIFANNGEMDSYIETTALYREQVGYSLTRTLQNLENTRAKPMF